MGEAVKITREDLEGNKVIQNKNNQATEVVVDGKTYKVVNYTKKK